MIGARQVFALLLAASIHAPASAQHVPPAPPSHAMPEMSNREMIEVMEMDDTARYGKLSFDELEWRSDRHDSLVWDLDAWYGGDYDKLWIKSHGSLARGEVDNLRVEALWDHAVARWWSLQTGVRVDDGEGPSRTWAALGVQGLAPYWFEIEATVYAGEQGRTAARFKSEYDLRLTQQLIAQPALELDLYGKDDPERGIGSGLSDLQLGLRLRYEIKREFAPYIGVQWTRRFGTTADLAKDQGLDASETELVAGLRVWF